LIPSAVSLFSGLGGLDLGFERAGFQIVWANDVSEDAVRSYKQNFGLRPVLGSINELSNSEILEADVVIGGPPCQSFSLVGQRDPDDPRGSLVFRFVDVVRTKRPRAFLMENVPGMLSSRINGARLTEVLVEQFAELGYTVGVYSLLATDFLVPQKRRRVFIIGGRGFEPVEPIGADFARTLPVDGGHSFGARDAIGDLGRCVEKGQLAGYRLDVEPSAFASLMRGDQEKVSLHECPRMSEKDQQLVGCIPPGGNYMDVPDDVATPRILRFKKTGGRTTTYGRLHPDRPSYTINTYFRRPNVGANFHYEEPRLITPREAMRFQSFPDRFEVAFRTQDGRNSLIGNAVPPLMAQGVAWSILEAWHKRRS
jgi:DNA (cytosine-5)-methyltransferase 1